MAGRAEEERVRVHVRHLVGGVDSGTEAGEGLRRRARRELLTADRAAVGQDRAAPGSAQRLQGAELTVTHPGRCHPLRAAAHLGVSVVRRTAGPPCGWAILRACESRWRRTSGRASRTRWWR